MQFDCAIFIIIPEQLAESYRLLRAEHKAIAQASIAEYKQQRSTSQQAWKKITDIETLPRQELTPSKLQELADLKENFVALTDAVYQMG